MKALNHGSVCNTWFCQLGITDSICFEISNVVGTFGMPDQDRVFERYYRHPNSIAVPGMGLGLSLVKAAAAKIGASVDFRHARDTVTFTVRVPN